MTIYTLAANALWVVVVLLTIKNLGLMALRAHTIALRPQA